MPWYYVVWKSACSCLSWDHKTLQGWRQWAVPGKVFRMQQWARLNRPGQGEWRRAQALPCCETGGCSQSVLGDMWHHGPCYSGVSRSPKSHRGGRRCLHWCNLIQRMFSVLLSPWHCYREGTPMSQQCELPFQLRHPYHTAHLVVKGLGTSW